MKAWSGLRHFVLFLLESNCLKYLLKRGRVVLETAEAIRCRKAANEGPPWMKLLAGANKTGTAGAGRDGMRVKSRKMEAGIWLFAFGMTDREILMCYRAYSGNAKNTEEGEALLKRTLAECMEETLFAQYETGMALFCLIAEGLPGNWQPGVEVKKRIREKVRPLIAPLEQNTGSDNSGKKW